MYQQLTVFLEKLIGPLFVKNPSTGYGTQKFITTFTAA